MEKYSTYKQYTKGLDKKTLTQEEFIALIQEDCYYCGKHKANGIAKINNNEKYVKRNCVPCCKQCSRTKNILSQKDFEAWKDRFVNFQLKKLLGNQINENIKSS